MISYRVTERACTGGDAIQPAVQYSSSFWDNHICTYSTPLQQPVSRCASPSRVSERFGIPLGSSHKVAPMLSAGPKIPSSRCTHTSMLDHHQCTQQSVLDHHQCTQQSVLEHHQCTQYREGDLSWCMYVHSQSYCDIRRVAISILSLSCAVLTPPYMQRVSTGGVACECWGVTSGWSVCASG